MDKALIPRLQFDNSFFEDEVREDFFVPGIMKRVWAAQMEVLAEVIRVCELHGISYYLSDGTLLGAVRHKGFIPWDDDIDIYMKRRDYMRFLYVAEKELPKGYEVVSIYSGKKTDTDVAIWVVNGNDFCIDSDFLEKNHGYPFFAGIDIFPLDGLPPEDEMEAFSACIGLVGAAIYATQYPEKSEIAPEELYQNVEEICGISIDRNGDIKSQLDILFDKLSSIYPVEQSDQVTVITYWKDRRNFLFQKKSYESSIDLDFEHISYKAPIGYRDILKAEFGDYENIVRGGSDHDYPIIAGQLKKIELEHGLFYGNQIPDADNITKSLERFNRRMHGLCVRGETLVAKGKTAKKKILFIAFSGRYWNSFSSIYEKAVDAGCDVQVVAIPYYRKCLECSEWHTENYESVISKAIKLCEDESEIEYSHQLAERVFNIDEYPKELKVISYKEFDFLNYFADQIIIQYPYDAYSASITIDPRYYAENLIDHTDEMVYVPYFQMQDFEEDDERSIYNMRYYVVMPGVILSDKVIVPTQRMRQYYIDCLTGIYGEGTRNFWEAKIENK